MCLLVLTVALQERFCDYFFSAMLLQDFFVIATSGVAAAGEVLLLLVPAMLLPEMVCVF